MPERRSPAEDRGKGRESGKRFDFPSRGPQEREGSPPKAVQRERTDILEERRAEPSPLNGRCNNFCQLFWCTKRAYSVRRDFVTGKKFVFCSWIGDECIGASCQYATCKGFYMLPDGSCAWAKQKKLEAGAEAPEITEEPVDEKAKRIVARRLGRKGLEELY